MRFEELKPKIQDLTYLDEGWRGVVYRGFFEGKEVAIKVAKSQEKEYAIRKEARILERLKDYPYFPKLILRGEDFIMYDFIDGVPMEKLSLSPEERLSLYMQVLEIAYLLDSLRINRDEFARLDKNLLVGKDGRIYLLDFERGALDVKKPHNFTQFLQFLRKEGIISTTQALELGKEYKKEPERVKEKVHAILSSALSIAT